MCSIFDTDGVTGKCPVNYFHPDNLPPSPPAPQIGGGIPPLPPGCTTTWTFSVSASGANPPPAPTSSTCDALAAWATANGNGLAFACSNVGRSSVSVSATGAVDVSNSLCSTATDVTAAVSVC